MEGVGPAIRVRIDQCREGKKSYINIYYVDTSIDKSSLARARSPGFSLCLLFTFSLPQPARAPPNLPLTGHLPPTEPPGKTGLGSSCVVLEGLRIEIWGPFSVPVLFRRREVDVSVPDRFPSPGERRPVGQRLERGRWKPASGPPRSEKSAGLRVR